MSEHALQAAVVALCRFAADTGRIELGGARHALTDEQRAALRLVHHARNGGASKSENGRAKAMGVVAGWPDLEVPTPDGVVFIELKTRTGRVSPKQAAVHEGLRGLGYTVHVCRSVDGAVAAIAAALGIAPFMAETEANR